MRKLILWPVITGLLFLIVVACFITCLAACGWCVATIICLINVVTTGSCFATSIICTVY